MLSFLSLGVHSAHSSTKHSLVSALSFCYQTWFGVIHVIMQPELDFKSHPAPLPAGCVTVAQLLNPYALFSCLSVVSVSESSHEEIHVKCSVGCCHMLALLLLVLTRPKPFLLDCCTQSADTSKNKWNIMEAALETWGAKSLVSPNNLRYKLECLHRILAWVGTPMKHSRI